MFDYSDCPIRDERVGPFKLHINASQLSSNGLLKPNAYLELSCHAADLYHESMGLSLQDMIGAGQAWIITAANFSIKKHVSVEHHEISAVTWLEGTRGPYAQRKIEFSLDGEVYFTTTFYCVFFDLKSRTFFRKVPAGVYGKNTNSKEASPPRMRVPEKLTAVLKRTVMPSDIDCIGHANNTRYGAYAFDALTADEIANFKNVREFEIQFRRELPLGETFEISRTKEDDKIYIVGSSGGNSNFESFFRFG